MATSTAHFSFTKADKWEYYDVGVVNANLDRIDEEIFNNRAWLEANLPDVAAMIAVHNESELSHADLRQQVAENERKIDAMALSGNTSVTGNQFTVLFDDLEDIAVTGVWNSGMQRMEFGEVN